VYTKLLADDVNAAISKADLLYETLRNTQLLSSAAKKIYYNLFQSITDYYENCFNLSSTENIINYNNSNAFEAQLLSDLHAYLLTLINVSKSLLPVPKGNITDLAIFFLEQHYSNPDLSIGDIEIIRELRSKPALYNEIVSSPKRFFNINFKKN